MIHEHRADVPGSIPSEGSPPGPACGGWVPPLTAHHFLSCFPAWRLPQGPPGRLISITNGDSSPFSPSSGATWDLQPEKLDFTQFHRKLRHTPKQSLPHIDREG